MNQLRNLRVTSCQLIIAAALTSVFGGCGNRTNPESAPQQPARTKLLFYKHKGSENFFEDLSQVQMANSLKSALQRTTGALKVLNYSRLSQFPANSPWHEIARTRASTYAGAVRMLHEHGLYLPVLISVSQIQGYLKYHDDLWYAALELALNQEIPGAGFGRKALASRILEDLKKIEGPLSSLRISFENQMKVQSLVANELQPFWKQDPFQFKPISFYTGPELEKIWMSDRFLLGNQAITSEDEQAFNEYYQTPGSGAQALAALKDLFAHVTNRHDPALFSGDGIARLINQDRRRSQGEFHSFWAPASPGVLERMSQSDRAAFDRAGSPQPAMNEIVSLIKTGALSMKPRADEGFMIYQRYAIEPLLTFKHLPEGQIVKPSPEILEVWKEVYQAASAKIQETHQKVIDSGAASTSMPAAERLMLEPVPTFYLREYQAYQFLRAFAATLPSSFSDRWRIDGRSARDFFGALAEQMLALYVLSAKELALSYDESVTASIQDAGEERLFAAAKRFLEKLSDSPAMIDDQRFLAVQRRPGGRKSDNCNGQPGVFWSTVGIEAVPVHVASSSWNRNGGLYSADMVVLVDHFLEQRACLDEPLTRAEWRGLLDQSQDSDEIAKRLGEF